MDLQFRDATLPAARQAQLEVIPTVKDAADRGYRGVCLGDACQAEAPERHPVALACFVAALHPNSASP